MYPFTGGLLVHFLSLFGEGLFRTEVRVSSVFIAFRAAGSAKYSRKVYLTVYLAKQATRTYCGRGLRIGLGKYNLLSRSKTGIGIARACQCVSAGTAIACSSCRKMTRPHGRSQDR